MAFEVLSQSKPSRRRNQAPAVHIYTSPYQNAPDLVDVRIRLTAPLMEQLGWGDGEKINVLVGTDEHAGDLMLEASPMGVFCLRRRPQSKSTFYISSRAIPLPSGIKIKAPFKIQPDRSLLVTYRGQS